MKNIIKVLSLTLIFALTLSIVDADAQTRKKKSDKVDEYFDDQGTILQRLWYGGDLSFNFIPLGTVGNIIAYGISPMAGLKVNEWFTVGPRIQFSVLNGKINESIQIPGTSDDFSNKYNAVTIGAGIFARAKIGQTYFAQIEFDRVSYSQPSFLTSGIWLDSDGEIAIDRNSQSHFYIGGGYNSQISDLWGLQFTILFDTLADRDTWENALPIVSRFGVNYKF